MTTYRPSGKSANRKSPRSLVCVIFTVVAFIGLPAGDCAASPVVSRSARITTSEAGSPPASKIRPASTAPLATSNTRPSIDCPERTSSVCASGRSPTGAKPVFRIWIRKRPAHTRSIRKFPLPSVSACGGEIAAGGNGCPSGRSITTAPVTGVPDTRSMTRPATRAFRTGG